MGLDMYLEKKYSLRLLEGHSKVTIEGEDSALPIEIDNVVTVVSEIFYWRMANAIHGWFVDNIQHGLENHCQRSIVSRGKLRQLLYLCRKVVSQPEMAGELLPTRHGPLFGSTDYDAYYFEQLEETIHVLEKELAKADSEISSYYYIASW